MGLISKLTQGLLFAFPAVLMSVKNGGSVILLVLLLISLGHLTINRCRVFYELDRHESWFIKIIFFYVAVYVFNAWYFNSDISSLDNALQILLIIPIFIVVRQMKLQPTFFYYSILLSAFACFFIAAYQYYFLNINRPLGVTSIISFGSISMTLSIMCFSIALMSQSKLIKLFFYLGFLLAVYASVLTLSRGAWLILLTSVLILFFTNPVKWSLSARVSSLLLACVFIVSSYWHPSIQNRADIAVKEVNAYFQKGVSKSSVGVRLELWRAALMVSEENPILGIGEGNFKKKMKELSIDKKIDPFVVKMNHVHQEYLSALLHRGILGLVSLLLIFLFPFVYFLKQLKSSNRDQIILSTLGLILVGSAMTISLSDVYFMQHQNMLFYFSFMFMLFVMQKNITTVKES